jgi:hypothetical protein
MLACSNRQSRCNTTRQAATVDELDGIGFSCVHVIRESNAIHIAAQTRSPDIRIVDPSCPREDIYGNVLHLKAGDPIIEAVNTLHYGINEGTVPAEIVVFYAGIVGQAVTVSK